MCADEEKVMNSESDEYAGLKSFFSMAGKVIGTLAGLGAMIILLGYTIILSFVGSLQLYGLTSFPQDFYKEAALTFLGDMFETYGKHPAGTGVMLLTITAITYICFRFQRKLLDTIRTEIADVVAGICILGIIMLTLRLAKVPDAMFGITEGKKVVLFMISVPVLVGIFVYLACMFGAFVKKPFRHYYVMVLLFLGLFIAVPVAYGDNIFDIDIYPVSGFDYADGVAIDALRELKRDINSQEGGTLFFLMGHTTDREIFFDNQALSPPAKMVLVERGLIKYLKVSKNNLNTVRNILGKQQTEKFETPSRAVDPLPRDLIKEIQ